MSGGVFSIDKRHALFRNTQTPFASFFVVVLKLLLFQLSENHLYVPGEQVSYLNSNYP